MNYDVYDHFPLRGAADDGKFDRRAIVEYSVPKKDSTEKVTVLSLFPPTQFKTTANKYEFGRHLEMFVRNLRENHGAELVNIHYEGSEVYDRYRGQIKKESYNKRAQIDSLKDSDFDEESV